MVVARTLTISAVSSDEKDPHGQDGFFAISGKFEVEDMASMDSLAAAFKRKSSVTIKCVLLEATGIVQKLDDNAGLAKGTLSIDSITLHPVHAKTRVLKE